MILLRAEGMLVILWLLVAGWLIGSQNRVTVGICQWLAHILVLGTLWHLRRIFHLLLGNWNAILWISKLVICEIPSVALRTWIEIARMA